MKTQARDRLTEILGDGLDVHRCAAARALGAMGMQESSGPLASALLDEDPDVRVDAATALGELNDPATAGNLMENLVGDPDGGVKRAAIKTLVAMRYEPVLPLLRKLAVSRADEDVAWDEEAFYQDGWDDWVDIQMTAFEGLAVFAPQEAVPEILAAMTDVESQDLTEPGLRALARMGLKGAMAIIDLYGHGDTRMCRRIVRAVGASDNPHLAELREGMVGDIKPEIRRLALENLSVDDPALHPLFTDESAEVRAAVVRHAGHANLSLLEPMIADPSDDVRAGVFAVIAENPGAFRTKELTKAVQQQIKGDPAAAKLAALALIAIKGPKAVKGLLHVPGNADIPLPFRIGVIEALQNAGDTAVPALLSVAGDEDRQLRLASLTALAEIAAMDGHWPNPAGLGLITALEGRLVLDPDQDDGETPKQEEDQSGDIDGDIDGDVVDDEMPEEILKEIEDSVPLVAEPAPVAGSTLDAIMANVPDTPVEAPKEVELSDEEKRFVDMATRRKKAKRKIEWATAASPHEDVQRFSARLLGAVIHPEVTRALIDALQRDIDDETRQAVLFSLARHADQAGALPAEAAEQLEPLLDSDDSDIRANATRAYGWLQGEAIESRLLELLNHEDPLVRVEAVHALAQRGYGGAAMYAALEDSYLGVGIAAARALARLNRDDAAADLVRFAVRNDGTYRRDIGKLLGKYAPAEGASQLLKLLGDDTRKASWLVAIDALAELFSQPEQDGALIAA